MPFALSDIFIGEYPITQDFGANPQIYSSRYGLKGHNGTDFGAPTNTMILSAADGTISETGFDAAGYGNYVKIKHDGYLTLYGHLNDYQIKTGDKVIAGQLIAHSNNTGNSTGPHLHFGVAPCDVNGIKTQMNNGYSGYIDPMGGECVWAIKNLNAPVSQNDAPATPDVSVLSSDFTRMVAQGTNYKVVATFALGNGLNDFLSANNQGVVDLEKNADDPSGGNKINLYIADLLVQVRDLRQSINQAPGVQAAALLQTQKDNIVARLTNAVKNFIFQS